MKKLLFATFCIFISSLTFSQVRMDLGGAIKKDTVRPDFSKISQKIKKENNSIGDTTYLIEVDDIIFEEKIGITIYAKDTGLFYIIVKYLGGKEVEEVFKQSFIIPKGKHQLDLTLDTPRGQYMLFIWKDDSEYYLFFNLFKTK